MITSSRFGLAYGSGRSSTALVTLKIALLAPIPSARVRTDVTVNAGFLRRERTPITKSLNDIFDTTPAVSALSQNGRVPVARPIGTISTSLAPPEMVKRPTDGSRLNRRGPAAPGFTTNRPPTREIF